MVSISRLIAGLFFIFLGIFLIVLSFYVTFVFLIYGIPMVAVGVWLLLNKDEDKIEERKDIKIKESKK
jgi:membrane-bound ClpP family serine protease